MITAVIFSRDRAMQLDLLLRSLEQNAPGMFEPRVIWLTTAPEHEAAYINLAHEHSALSMWREAETTNLAYDTSGLLEEEWGADLSCFLTDDSVLYRSLPAEPELGSGVLCFSLRLGLNTTWCYPHNQEQRVPPMIVDDQSRAWKWRQAEHDFSYAGSLDGHIFRAETLRHALADCPAGNPNRIEEHLMNRFNDSLPLMASFEHSVLLGLPVNRVNTTNPNRNGQAHPWSVKELNRRYLRGERIDLDELDFSDVRGAHQEIPLVFR